MGDGNAESGGNNWCQGQKPPLSAFRVTRVLIANPSGLGVKEELDQMPVHGRGHTDKLTFVLNEPDAWTESI